LFIENLSVGQSNLDNPIDEEGVFQTFSLLTQFAMQLLNEKVLGHGIPLPCVPDVILTDTLVTIEEGYLWVEANPIYNITSLLLSHF
jgi:hypothetical protein